jgi:large subunit ribosomal protein L4
MTALCKCSNKILVIENNFNFLNKPSTKEISLQLKKINPESQNSKCLVIAHEINENLMLSMRNLNYVDLISHKKLNLRQLLIAKTIIITEKALLNITTL